MAVRADEVAENDGAEERTMARSASGVSCDGGSVGDGVWKKSGCALSISSRVSRPDGSQGGKKGKAYRS